MWTKNEGRCPYEAEIRGEDGSIASYRAVHVRLFGGYDSKAEGHAPWPAGGRVPSTVWKISRQPHPFEIEFYEIT